MHALQRLLLVMLLVAAGLAGCARGPDEEGLRRDVQAQLDTLFGSRMLEVQSLRRQGSAPLAGSKDGGKQAIVYYNAILAFTAPYDPSDWSSLSPELIASALGATDEGVIGLARGRIDKGTQLRAYGSMVYRREGSGWQASLLPPPAQVQPDATAAGATTRSSELIKRLAGVVNTTPGLHDADDEIVAEELNRALQNIRLRLNQGDGGLLVATGPPGGEYARFVESLRPRGAQWAVTQANTQGSVENALKIDSGEARFGLVQSDVAAAAITGQGTFSGQGPLRHLRAVAALFPEPVHVVVRPESGITSVAALAGKRIAAGSWGSGTRQTAMQVLRAHGVDPAAAELVEARSPDEALQLLAAGSIDAVIEVVSAPWRQLAAAAVQTPLVLLSLDAEAMATMAQSVPGLMPLTVAERTYAGQEQPVATMAATALLVANEDVPAAAVQQLLDFLFRSGLAAERGVSAARLSRERALAGVTLPLHDGAAEFYGETRPARTAANPAPVSSPTPIPTPTPAPQ